MKRAWSFNYCLIASNRFEVHNTCHPKDFCSRLWHWQSWEEAEPERQHVLSDLAAWDTTPEILAQFLVTHNPDCSPKYWAADWLSVGIWPSSITCLGHWTWHNISQRSHASRPEFPDTLTDNTMMAIPGLNSKRIKNSVIYETGRFTLCLYLCWWDEEKEALKGNTRPGNKETLFEPSTAPILSDS